MYISSKISLAEWLCVYFRVALPDGQEVSGATFRSKVIPIWGTDGATHTRVQREHCSGQSFVGDAGQTDQERTLQDDNQHGE